jgi:hypothetical protein
MLNIELPPLFWLIVLGILTYNNTLNSILSYLYILFLSSRSCLYIYSLGFPSTSVHAHVLARVCVPTHVPVCVPAQLHIHTHTLAYIWVRAQAHTRICDCIHVHACIPTYVPMHIRACTCASPHAHIHTRVHTPAHVYTCIHIHTLTPTYTWTHTCTRPCLHAYPHTPIHYVRLYIHAVPATHVPTLVSDSTNTYDC